MACDRRGVLLAACGLVFLVLLGLATWALVESITGMNQVSTFWSIEESLRNQVCTTLTGCYSLEQLLVAPNLCAQTPTQPRVIPGR